MTRRTGGEFLYRHDKVGKYFSSSRTEPARPASFVATKFGNFKGVVQHICRPCGSEADSDARNLECGPAAAVAAAAAAGKASS